MRLLDDDFLDESGRARPGILVLRRKLQIRALPKGRECPNLPERGASLRVNRGLQLAEQCSAPQKPQMAPPPQSRSLRSSTAIIRLKAGSFRWIFHSCARTTVPFRLAQ